MESHVIREKFLDFFRSKGHTVKESSSLVPDDPTLLLTAAGMVQFKPVFEGKKKVDFTTAATCQKCVRTTDIERVGQTARHLTFFEMLGNFSFGDYFKEGAIRLAFEFLTEHLHLPMEHLYVTVYKDDDEAFAIWEEKIGFDRSKIVRLGDEDNFWSAGPTGACGPCSEIIFDRGPTYSCGEPDCFVGCDCDRYLEVWNLVFMQYDRDEKGELHPLPTQNIDTGMGLERISALLQDHDNVFYTDLFDPIIKMITEVSGAKLGEDAKKDVSIKVMADHSRAITFLISDGVIPSNEGRGYILRRLIRRVVRHSQLLGIEKPILTELCTNVIMTMGRFYKDLVSDQEFILKITGAEEERFLTTLKQGTSILHEVVDKVRARAESEIGGEIVFQLYDTYGFPAELTAEIAEEYGLTIDMEGFTNAMEEQRARARGSWVGTGPGSEEVYRDILGATGANEFVGYEERETDSLIQAIIKGKAVASSLQAGDEGEIVLSKTPFYAEMGGQVGDSGYIESASGKFKVLDTFTPAEGLFVHRGKMESGTLKHDENVTVRIEGQHRDAVARNHTATHILQWALRIVLGKHVKQAGSFVGEDRLRFDFVNPKGLSSEEIQKIERLVLDKILQNQPVKHFTTTLEYAKESGAIAFFGDKYGDFVRVVETGDFSKELCGGTHVGRTGDIGLFKIISEGSIGANVRRIEALTGTGAYEFLTKEGHVLEGIAQELKADRFELPERIDQLLAKQKDLEREIERLSSHVINAEIDLLVKEPDTLEGADLIIKKVAAASVEELRRYLDAIRPKLRNDHVVVLLASDSEKAFMIVAVSPTLTAKIKAGDIVKESAPLIGGGGGGKPELAQAGGKDPAGIEAAISKAGELVRLSLSS